MGRIRIESGRVRRHDPDQLRSHLHPCYEDRPRRHEGEARLHLRGCSSQAARLLGERYDRHHAVDACGDPRHRRGPTRRSAEIKPRHGVEQIDRFLSNRGSDVEAMTPRGRDSCSVGGARSSRSTGRVRRRRELHCHTQSGRSCPSSQLPNANQPSPPDTYRKRSAGLT